MPTAWRWLADYAVAKERLVIGLISGTSADGVDAALVRVVGMAPQRVETLAFTTLPYPADLRRVVLQASHDGDAATLCWLHFALGELFAEAARRVAELARVPLQRVCLIGSHGQTVRHLPPPLRRARRVRRFARMGTLQLASPAVIALRTGVPVVSDFRAKDMAAGGQGAPLVSLVDWLLLRHPHKTRVALNLGGIPPATESPFGVSVASVHRVRTFSLAGLRRLRFGDSEDEDVKARATLLAMLLLGAAYADADTALRAYCDLTEPNAQVYLDQELVDLDLSIESCEAFLGDCIDALPARLRWSGQVKKLVGDPELSRGSRAESD